MEQTIKTEKISWVQRQMHEENQAKIRKAIEKAELRTSAEIVPIIVRSSTGFGHVFPLLTLFLFVVAEQAYHSVSLDIFYPIPPSAVGLVMVFLALALSFGLSRLGFIQRALTSQREQTKCVEWRALTEFYSAQMSQTLSRTGILLFLSLRERRAVVLADETIAKKLPGETWNEVVKLLVETARNESLTDGLVVAIHRCGEIAARDFPRKSGSQDELPNKLIVKE